MSKYASLAVSYRQGRTEVLGGKPIPEPASSHTTNLMQTGMTINKFLLNFGDFHVLYCIVLAQTEERVFK
jgi:hypothetical protein